MKQSKKLLSSVAVLVVALAMAISSTWAWFTMSTTANISGLNVNVTAYEGMEIAISKKGEVVTRGDYKVTISGAEIIELLELYQAADVEEEIEEASFALDAVTSPDGKNFYYGYYTPGEEDSLVPADEADANGINGQYIEFDLHFMADSPYPIVLDFSGTEKTGVTLATSPSSPDHIKAYWWEDALTNYASYFGADETPGAAPASGSIITASAANAVRISFEDNKSGGKGINVYEPNHKNGFSGAGNLALEYYNYNTGKSLAVPTGADAPVATTINSESGSTVAIVQLDGGDATFTGKVTVRIWIEGYDGDALNSILQQIVNINLKFNVLPTP